MADKTNIAWADSTMNFFIGCTKVSPACQNCYAAELDANRFSKMLGGATKEHPVSHWGPGAPRWRTSEDNWKKPYQWNKKPFICNVCGMDCYSSLGHPPGEYDCIGGPAHRRRVFSLSLGDWLDEEVPIEWLADMLKVIHETPNLTWLLLTKRPENWLPRILDCIGRGRTEWLASWVNGDPPMNVHIGATVENQHYADIRIPQLLKIPAHRRFLSFEPLLSDIDFSQWLWGLPNPICANCPKDVDCECGFKTAKQNGLPSIDQVIVGGESGPGHRPLNLDWMRSIRDQCRAAGVAYFAKQDSHARAGQRGRIPDDLWVQEETR